MLISSNPVDGRLAVAGKEHGEFRIRNADGVEELLFKGFEWTRAMEWSHDGRLATMGVGGRLNVLDERGKKIFGPKSLHPSDRHDLRWSPDDRRLATVGDDNMIRIWNTKTWELVWETTKEQFRVANGLLESGR